MEEAIKALLEQKDRIARLQAAVKDAEVEYAIMVEAVYQALADEGLESVKCQGHTITRTQPEYPRILPDKKAEAFEWLREQGAGDLVQETVNLNSLRSQFRKNEWDLPEDLFSVFKKNDLSIRRNK